MIRARWLAVVLVVDPLWPPPQAVTPKATTARTSTSRFTAGTLDLLQRARLKADVERHRLDEDSDPLLPEDVRRPADRPPAGEHSGRERRRNLGDVEDDGRPILDVRPGVARALLRDRLMRDLH